MVSSARGRTSAAMNADVIRVINILEFRRSPVQIKKRHVLDWLLSNDPNVIAAAVDAILMHNDCISPRLTNDEILDLLQRNFMLNLSTEKAPTLYGHSCYEAGRTLFMWVLTLFDTGHAPGDGEALRRLSSYLSGLYLSASEKQRNCIVNGVLEHLFESDAVREHFEFWQGQDILREAYINARRWSDWSKARLYALEEVTYRTAELLRGAGHVEAFVNWPGPASVIPTISVKERVLMISCDTAWVELFQVGRLNLTKAAEFAADEKNWSPVAEGGLTHVVELRGRTFEG